MVTKTADLLSCIVGVNLVRIREALGYAQQDVAKAAANWGVRWDRSAVSRIESGQRSVNLTELAVLAAVLNSPTVEFLRVNPDAEVSPFGRPLTLFQLWTGFRVKRWPDWTPPSYAAITEADRQVGRIAHERAVRRAAAALDLPAELVARACWALWRHGFTEERDRRAGTIDPRGRSARALRAMVTPQLLDEVRAWPDSPPPGAASTITGGDQ